MATCKECKAPVIQLLNAANNLPLLIDREPDTRLGMLSVNWQLLTCKVLSIGEREAALRNREDLYTNHASTCTARERDRSYQDDVERMVG